MNKLIKIIIVVVIGFMLFYTTIETSPSNYDINQLVELSIEIEIANAIEQHNHNIINRAAEYYNIEHELAKYIFDICQGLDLNYNIFMELINIESGFDPNAISTSNAIGFCQIKDSAVNDVIRLHGMALDKYNPMDNILIGAYYLHSLIYDYELELKEALMFYNGGTIPSKQEAAKKYANKIMKKYH